MISSLIYDIQVVFQANSSHNKTDYTKKQVSDTALHLQFFDVVKEQSGQIWLYSLHRNRIVSPSIFACMASMGETVCQYEQNLTPSYAWICLFVADFINDFYKLFSFHTMESIAVAIVTSPHEQRITSFNGLKSN